MTTTSETVAKIAQNAGDVSSVGIVAGTFLGFLPYAAALLTVIWTGIRIYVWIEERIERARVKVEVDIKTKET
jgi:hypothetical protein